MKYHILVVFVLLTLAIILIVSYGYAHKQIYDFGPHSTTSDFKFQEQLRALELTVTMLAAKEIGGTQAEHLFIQGWTGIISAAYLLNQTHDVSKPFREVLVNELDKACSLPKVIIHDKLTANVIDSATKIKTFKERPGLGIKPIKIGNTIAYLNAIVSKHQLKFTLNKESRIYLEIAPEFFTQLWQSDFPSQLKKIGAEDLERNHECPHVTLIGSQSITLIKTKCYAEKGDQGKELFNSFITTLLDQINEKLKRADRPVVFTHLVTKHAESYALFDKVIMVDLHSPVVADAIKFFVEEVENRFQIKISATQPDKYHVTIAIKPKKPAMLAGDLTIQDLIKNTGAYSSRLQAVMDSQKP